MKKMGKVIALILILVIFSGNFTSCFTLWAVNEEPPIDEMRDPRNALGFLLILPIDVPIALVIVLIKIPIKAARNSRGRKLEGIDTFSAAASSLMGKIDALPEAARAPYTEKIDSFSESEIAVLLEAFNRLSDDEKISALEALDSMSEDQLIAALHDVQYIAFRYQE